VYGLVGGWIMHRLKGSMDLLIGAAFGLALYFVNFYVVAPAAFPWFVEARNWVGLAGHLIFGVVLGVAYAALRRHKPKPVAE
jgi:hypothetical protein